MKQVDVPPVWTVVALIMVWILNRLLPIFDFGRYIAIWVPILLIIVAITYIVLAARQFRAHKTSIFPRKRPKALITSGIFKISRNPIYTGFALIVLAFVIYQGDIIGFAALGAFIWVITKRFIIAEEGVILGQFPEAKKWFDSTNRW